jgi:hypothetical protein
MEIYKMVANHGVIVQNLGETFWITYYNPSKTE